MKILLIGANGKMGKSMQVVIRKNGHDFFGIDKTNREDANGVKVDVIVDFSSSLCLEENLKLAESKNIPIVIATTNHDENNLKLIEKFKVKIPIFMAANFSVLFHVMLKLLKQMKGLEECDFVVEDVHHKHKKDRPSGSCKEIVKSLNSIQINPIVTSYRVGEVIGIHSVCVFSGNERLEFKHEVESRDVFCEGALKACKFVLKKSEGLFGMNDLLDELED